MQGPRQAGSIYDHTCIVTCARTAGRLTAWSAVLTCLCCDLQTTPRSSRAVGMRSICRCVHADTNLYMCTITLQILPGTQGRCSRS